jgi:hypothetical protein
MKDAFYQPNPSDIGQLLAILKHPGYEVLKRIFESEIDRMQIDLLNTEPTNRDEILAKHNIAKAAAMFYARILQRIENEQDLMRTHEERGKIVRDPVGDSLFQ